MWQLPSKCNDLFYTSNEPNTNMLSWVISLLTYWAAAVSSLCLHSSYRGFMDCICSFDLRIFSCSFLISPSTLCCVNIYIHIENNSLYNISHNKNDVRRQSRPFKIRKVFLGPHSHVSCVIYFFHIRKKFQARQAANLAKKNNAARLYTI